MLERKSYAYITQMCALFDCELSLEIHWSAPKFNVEYFQRQKADVDHSMHYEPTMLDMYYKVEASKKSRQ